MMRVKLIVAGEERWLKHFYYEYFYPIEEITAFSVDHFSIFTFLETTSSSPSSLQALVIDSETEPFVNRNLAASNTFPQKTNIDLFKHQTYDSLVHPLASSRGTIRHQLTGGLFNLSFPSTEKDEFFWEWLLQGNMKHGHFEIYKGDDDHALKIEFWDCYCVGFQEVMHHGNTPMLANLRLSPAITRNRKVLEHKKIWKKTDIHSNLKPENSSTTNPLKEKEQEPAKLVSVELIDTNNQVLTGLVKQYVNLQSKEIYIDGHEIKDLVQLGQNLRCKVVFDKPGVHKFKIWLKSKKGNNTYSDSERTRNGNFKHLEKPLNFVTKNNGEVVIEGSQLFVSPGGKDVYSLIAADEEGNEKKSSGKVITERLIHFIEVKMKGLKSATKNLSTFKKEYEKHGITLTPLTPVEMPHISNIGDQTDSKSFLHNIQQALGTTNAANYDPHCVTIAYTDHLAVKKDFSANLRIKGANKAVLIPIRQTKTQDDFALWTKIDSQDWFVQCVFKPDDGDAAIPIPKNKCSIKEKPGFPGYFNAVEIDLKDLPQKPGKIKLRTNIVDRMRAGLSFRNNKTVAICTRCWWRNINDYDQNCVCIHEVGHQLGLVSDGVGIKPDKTPTYYDNNKGHVGPHCHFGIPAGQARYDAKADLTKSKCVMYGSVNGSSRFCKHCSESLRKSDLKNGLS